MVGMTWHVHPKVGNRKERLSGADLVKVIIHPPTTGGLTPPHVEANKGGYHHKHLTGDEKKT